jgi:hypothetical protein
VPYATSVLQRYACSGVPAAWAHVSFPLHVYANVDLLEWHNFDLIECIMGHVQMSPILSNDGAIAAAGLAIQIRGRPSRLRRFGEEARRDLGAFLRQLQSKSIFNKTKFKCHTRDVNDLYY